MKKILIFIIVVVIAVLGFYLLNDKKDYKQPNLNNNTDNMSMDNKNMNNVTNETDLIATNTVDSNTSTESKNINNTNMNKNIIIKGFKFDSNNLTIKKGTTITWTNQDTAPHTVTENDDKTGPNSQTLATGESYSYTFNDVGTYSYHCTIHPSMLGKVTVVE